jgi:hypothetical protein
MTGFDVSLLRKETLRFMSLLYEAGQKKNKQANK